MYKLNADEITSELWNEINSQSILLNMHLEDVIVKDDINKNEIDKSMKLISLGFKNVPSVISGKKLKHTINLSKEQFNILKELNIKYPDSIFLNEETFHTIADKFGLEIKDVSLYKKEINNETYNQITNKLKTVNTDLAPILYKVEPKYSWGKNDFELFCQIKGKKEPLFTNEEVMESHMKYRGNAPSTWFFGKRNESMCFYDEMNHHFCQVSLKSTIYRDTSKLHILAPYNHFFNVKVKLFSNKHIMALLFDFKSPIIFNYCKGGFIRIITINNKIEKSLEIKSDLV